MSAQGSSEHRATVSAERLVIESPTTDPDARPWTVIVEASEFSVALHSQHADFPKHVTSAVAVFLDVDKDVDQEGFDKVAVQTRLDQEGLAEPLRRALAAVRTALEAVEQVGRVTLPSHSA